MCRSVLFSLVLMLCCSAELEAHQVSEAELIQLTSMFSPKSVNAILLESKEQLNHRLGDLETNQSIWLRQLWLNKLAQLSHPSASQQAWLRQELSSEQRLTTSNHQHPKQGLILVDIARQAKTTEMQWKINRYVEQLQLAWEHNKLDWPSVISSQDKLQRRGFIQWLGSASEQQGWQVAQQYSNLAPDLPQPINELLAKLAVTGKSPFLLARLWQQKADEHTYQTLNTLPFLLADYQVIEQLALALKNKDIQSQALFTLASRYSGVKQAQVMLSKALQEPELKWYGAAVLSEVKDEAFIAELKEMFKAKVPSTFTQLAQKTLQQAQQGRAQQ